VKDSFYSERHKSVCIKHKFIKHATYSPRVKENVLEKEGIQHELCAFTIAVCEKRNGEEVGGHVSRQKVTGPDYVFARTVNMS
jgi:hypothetical protein